MEFFASCPAGFERALASELKQIGAGRVRPLTGRVTFEGGVETALGACMWSRLASRICLVLGRFACEGADDLYEGAYAVPWEDVIAPGATIAMSSHGSGERLRNTNYISLCVKDAVCDRMVDETGRRPRVDPDRPDAHIVVTLRRGRASIALDLAGDPLFRRLPRSARTGRGDGVRALRPDYAALALATAGWDEACSVPGNAGVLVCSAGADGGIPLEAARMLQGRAPGRGRSHWGFRGWAEFDPALWAEIVSAADARALAGSTHPGTILVATRDDEERRTVRRLLGDDGLMRSVAFANEDPSEIAAMVDEALATGDEGGARRAAIVVEIVRNVPDRAAAHLALAAHLRTACSSHGAPLVAVAPDKAISRALRCDPALAERIMPDNEEAWLLSFSPAEDAPASTEIDLGDGATVPVLVPESEQFANRLKKVARLRRKWARRTGVSCYRVYDADLPDYAAAIDLYAEKGDGGERWLVISEYAAPKTIDPGMAQARMLDIIAIAPRVLDVDPSRVRARARMRSRGGSQYGRRDARHGGTGKQADRERTLPLIEEGGLTFAVNLDDYLDTGIFLDHRVTRSIVRDRARSSESFLNLFAYTGTATCYAADGGAKSTCTVDLSNTYLDWARENMRLNGFTGPGHEFVRADVMTWILDQRRGSRRWDLIFCDPPTFSNSTKMGSRTFDVQRDHVELLEGVAALLAPGGEAIFSCNLRSFKPDTEALRRAGIELEDISERTIPEDFARNKRIHRCFVVRNAD